MLRNNLGEISVALVALAILVSLEALFRPLAIEGLYFQVWTSDAMMQTVSIVDLAEEPGRSLWYLHIQPPALDSIRAVLAGLAKLVGSRTPDDMLRQVDRGLYVMWAGLYALLGVVLYRWIAEITTQSIALAATLLFLLHPAGILYASFLDSTFLSALLTTWFFAALWRLKDSPTSSVLPLAMATICCFLTRSLFQWPFMAVTMLAMICLRVPKQSIARYLMIAGAVVGLYSFKQEVLFGTVWTSSFVGYNLNNSIDRRPAEFFHLLDRVESVTDPKRGHISVLTRTTKLGGTPNFNHSLYLELNRDLLVRYRQQIASLSLRELLRVYAGNARIWLLPSASFTRSVSPHPIADRLPWRALYDVVFSYPVLPLLLLVFGLEWCQGSSLQDLQAGIGLLLPLAYIVVVSVLGESGENMRLKFFVEPTLYVFLVSGAVHTGRRFKIALGRPQAGVAQR